MTADTIGTEIELLKARLRVLERVVTNIQRDLARVSAPVAQAAPDGTVAIRDPNILAQEQSTGMRGYALNVPPE